MFFNQISYQSRLLGMSKFEAKYGIELTDMKKLCGGCLAWGVLPDMKDGKCKTCGRTPEQIASQE